MDIAMERKVKGGKMVKIKARIEEGVIKDIKITGDFFVYPEVGVEDIEQAVIGLRRDKEVIKNEIRKVLREKGIRLIGFSEEDVAEMISQS